MSDNNDGRRSEAARRLVGRVQRAVAATAVRLLDRVAAVATVWADRLSGRAPAHMAVVEVLGEAVKFAASETVRADVAEERLAKLEAPRVYNAAAFAVGLDEIARAARTINLREAATLNGH